VKEKFVVLSLFIFLLSKMTPLRRFLSFQIHMPKNNFAKAAGLYGNRDAGMQMVTNNGQFANQQPNHSHARYNLNPDLANMRHGTPQHPGFFSPLNVPPPEAFEYYEAALSADRNRPLPPNLNRAPMGQFAPPTYIQSSNMVQTHRADHLTPHWGLSPEYNTYEMHQMNAFRDPYRQYGYGLSEEERHSEYVWGERQAREEYDYRPTTTRKHDSTSNEYAVRYSGGSRLTGALFFPRPPVSLCVR